MLRHFAFAALLLLSLSTFAQETPVPTSGGKTPLGVRQQRVEQMTEQLERRFGALIQALQQTEPERAERLKKTLDEAKKLQLKDRMALITRSLDTANLETATDSQKDVLSDIRRLLALLLDEKSDKDKDREEFERLQEWKKNIEKIIQEEMGEKREADKLASKDKTLAGLEAKIKAINELIEKQQKIIADTQAAREEGIQAVGKIAPKQEQVRTETKKVADQIAKEAGDVPPAETKPAEGEKQ